MLRTNDDLALRACFLRPIPELDRVADSLSAAADCLLSGDLVMARAHVRDADMPAVFAYAARIMGREDFEIHRRRPVDTVRSAAAKSGSRMPSSVVVRSMYARDGWRCRFCGCRIVMKEARSAMRARLPGAIRWGETKGVYHAAFYALSAVPDHVVPHAYGGSNDLDNLVTACWPCNFGRSSWSLEEVGILDPRSRPPVVDAWDGLGRLLRLASASKQTRAEMPTPSVAAKLAAAADSPNKSRGSNADEWIAAINRFGPATSDRLKAFAEGASDWGVSWSINKVMIIRMRVGDTTIQQFGIEPNGDVSIPWFLGGKKEEFKHFAHVVADAIPGACASESPKQWIVKTDGRKINVREFLDASNAIAGALEGLNQRLRGT